jgi:hypothetical protein
MSNEFDPERAMEIGAEFLAWTYETRPCPISINDPVWFKRLCGLFETIAAFEAEREATCTWTEDSEGTWQTECGDAFVFTDGGPVENSVRYCCYCGKCIEIKPWEFERLEIQTRDIDESEDDHE